jgi:hypothetical protein
MQKLKLVIIKIECDRVENGLTSTTGHTRTPILRHAILADANPNPNSGTSDGR